MKTQPPECPECGEAMPIPKLIGILQTCTNCNCKCYIERTITIKSFLMSKEQDVMAKWQDKNYTGRI